MTIRLICPWSSYLAFKRNTSALFPHFSWVSRKPFIAKAADTSAEVLGVQGSVRVEFRFTATVALEKSSYFWNKRNRKEKYRGGGNVLYKIFQDKFSIKVREAHSDWVEKNILEPMIVRLAWLLQAPASVSEALKPEIESDSFPQLPFLDSTAQSCNSLKTLKCLSLPVRKDFLFLFLRH